MMINLAIRILPKSRFLLTVTCKSLFLPYMRELCNVLFHCDAGIDRESDEDNNDVSKVCGYATYSFSREWLVP